MNKTKQNKTTKTVLESLEDRVEEIILELPATSFRLTVLSFFHLYLCVSSSFCPAAEAVISCSSTVVAGFAEMTCNVGTTAAADGCNDVGVRGIETLPYHTHGGVPPIQRGVSSSIFGRFAVEEADELRELLRVERCRLANSVQREEVLRQRLIVAEEGHVLYHLYFERLLELLRTDREETSTTSTKDDSPLITKEDLLNGLHEALRSVGAATTGGTISNADGEGCIRGINCSGASGETESISSDEQKMSGGAAAPFVNLSNATLLTASALQMRVADALELRRREKARKHELTKRALKDVLCVCVEEIEARHATVLLALRNAERRVESCDREVSAMLKYRVRQIQDPTENLEGLRKKLLSLSQEHVRTLQELRLSQLEVAALKDDVVRAEARVTSLSSLNRAADSLEDARQGICDFIRTTASDIRQRVHRGITLNEPFIQSMRSVALKIEAQVERLRSDDWHRDDNCSGVAGSVDTVVDSSSKTCLNSDEPCGVVALPIDGVAENGWAPRSNEQREKLRLPLASRRAEVGSESLVATALLEELARVMNNFCRLLENNMEQAAANTHSIMQAIDRFETAVVNKLTDMWDSTQSSLASCGLTSSPSAHGSTPCGTVERETFCTRNETHRCVRNDTSPAVQPHATPGKTITTTSAVLPSLMTSPQPEQAVASPHWQPEPPQRRLVLHERDSFGTPLCRVAIIQQ